MKNFKPAPAAIRPDRKWDVVDSKENERPSPVTDSKRGSTIAVPLDDHPSEIAARANAYGRISMRGKISKEAQRIGGSFEDLIQDESFNALVDCYVNNELIERGVSDIKDAEYPVVGSARSLMLWRIRVEGLKQSKFLFNKEISETFKTFIPADHREILEKIVDDARKGNLKEAYKSLEEILPIVEFGRGFKISVMSHGKKPGKASSLVEILTPELTVNMIPPSLRKKKRKPDFFGPVINPPRLLPLSGDGMGFAIKKNVKESGASILIDCSGSMHVSARRVATMLTKMPTSTIMVYGPTGSTPYYLIVVGKNGKMLEPDSDLWDLIGYDNIVDAEGLKWLSNQPEPRFWITDFGVDDYQVCRSLVKKYKVRVLLQNLGSEEKVVQAIDRIKSLDKGDLV